MQAVEYKSDDSEKSPINSNIFHQEWKVSLFEVKRNYDSVFRLIWCFVKDTFWKEEKDVVRVYKKTGQKKLVIRCRELMLVFREIIKKWPKYGKTLLRECCTIPPNPETELDI